MGVGYSHGDFAKRPDRIEIRFVMGADSSGTVYQIERRRDTDQRVLFVDHQEDWLNMGDLSDGLRAMVAAAVPEPSWEQR